jgi:hypothetical protein
MTAGYSRGLSAVRPVAGDTSALELAADILKRAGRIDEAARLRRYGLEPGDGIANEWH